MPTSRVKNILYQLALPVFSPSVRKFSSVSANGYPLTRPDLLKEIFCRNHISGAAVFVQSGNHSSTVFTKAIHTDIAPDEHTFYRVASITKMATAFLAVRLMDLGLLDPEKPVSSLLPGGEKVPELKNVQISHLLSHTSGLKDPPDLEQKLVSRAPYFHAVAGCRIGNPGDAFRYSNLGYGLIGCIFESVLNKPLGEIYRDYLFSPLKMNAALEGCSLPESRIMPVIRMLPYREGTGLRITKLGRIPLGSPDPLFHYGHTAGSMYTDLPSLVRMTLCIRDGGSPFLSPKYSGIMQKEMASYGSLSPTLSYGSGLLIIRDKRISDSVVFGHQGFAYGCVDGSFWEASSGRILVSLNGGCSEARSGRIGLANLDFCRWAFRKELPEWK